MKTKFTAPKPPPVPELASLLVRRQHGNDDASSMSKRIGHAGDQVAATEKVKRFAAEAFSSREQMKWVGEYQKPQVMRLDQYLSTVVRKGWARGNQQCGCQASLSRVGA